MSDGQLRVSSGLTGSSEAVVGGVVIAALILFVSLGGTTLSSIVRGAVGLQSDINPNVSVALILNIAILIFGWRRYADLKKRAAAAAQAEERMVAASFTDFVTGLVNRATLHQSGDELLRAGVTATLLVFDLDHFKKVNDRFGHAAGDDLLKRVATLVVALSPADAMCARLGGDEFAVLLQSSTPDDAQKIAQYILTGVAAPVPVEGGLAHVTASIGISTNEAGASFSAMLRRSDIAMYHAKKRGRNCLAWFDAAMEAEVRRLNDLENEMRNGIPAGEFVPFYQPQYNLQTGNLHGFEVLARWIHPTRGIVEPTEFIPVAEGTGLIATLSLSVMRKALVDARAWDPALMIAVNVSPVQLKDPLLSQRILQLLTETNFAPQRLEVEVTESALFDDLPLALSTIESLKALGVTVSLDDFGTGYSSLSQLKALPFDRIKIDRSFVVSMLDNEESAAIVSAIAAMAKSLKLPVTAEGIETDAVRGALRELGCSEGQGWHYGRPLALEQICEKYPDLVLGKAVMNHGLTPLGSIPEPSSIPAPERRDRAVRGSKRAAA